MLPTQAPRDLNSLEDNIIPEIKILRIEAMLNASSNPSSSYSC
jgi:hypothetical protein